MAAAQEPAQDIGGDQQGDLDAGEQFDGSFIFCLTQDFSSQWDFGMLGATVLRDLKKKEALFSPIATDEETCPTVKSPFERKQCVTIRNLGNSGYLKKRFRTQDNKELEPQTSIHTYIQRLNPAVILFHGQQVLTASAFSMAFGAYAIGIILAACSFAWERLA